MTPASPAWRSRRQSATTSSPRWPLEVDDEAVVAQSLLGRSRLELGQVDVARGELAQDAVQAAGMVRPLEAHDARLVVARSAWAPGARPPARSGSGCRGGPRRPRPGSRGRSARRPGAGRWPRPRSSRSSPSTRAASAVELAARCSASGSVLARYFWHWARAWGYEDTVVTSASATPGRAMRCRWMSMTTSRWM